MHQHHGAVRRLLAALDHGARAGSIGQGLLGRLAQARDRKACGLQTFAGLLRRREKARFRRACPGRRIGGGAARPLRDLGQHEPAARAQHAMDLGVEAGLVGDVHRDIHRVGAIEARIAERHRRRVALLEVDPVLEAQHLRQLARDLAELGGEVDAGDPGAEALRDVARRAADAAADVQDVVAPRDREQARELFRRLEAAAVEVVVRRQRLHRQMVRIDAVVQQGGTQPAQQVAAAVMGRDVGGQGCLLRQIRLSRSGFAWSRSPCGSRRCRRCRSR